MTESPILDRFTAFDRVRGHEPLPFKLAGDRDHVLIFHNGKSTAPMHAQQVVKPLPIQTHAVRVAAYCA